MQSPWYGWAIITLEKLRQQAEDFSKDPPDGIKGLSMREQALGEMNGLNRFYVEASEVRSALIEQYDEEKNKPKEGNLNED